MSKSNILNLFGRDCKFCLGLPWLRVVGDELHPLFLSELCRAKGRSERCSRP